MIHELALFRRTDYSDECPSAMQRRYLMPQRSPAHFWLLVAATAFLNVAVLAGRIIEGRDSLEAVCYGAVFGQLNTVCVWCVFSRRPIMLRWLVTGLAVGAAALATRVTESADMP